MVDTPKGSDNEEKRDVAKDNSPNKQTKRRRKRRPKTGLDKNGTHTDPALEQGGAVDDAHATKQPSEHDELDRQPIPGEDDLTSPEHTNLHKRLVATARSLKKQKRKLKIAEDALRMRWSKVLNSADKHGASHQTKSYPKCKLLPEFDEEDLEPPLPKEKEAAWPDRRPDDRPLSQLYRLCTTRGCVRFIRQPPS